MCEPGKVGIWLTPEEAKVIVSTLRLLSSRIEEGAADHLRRLILEAATMLEGGREGEAPDETEPDPDDDEGDDNETTELIPIIELPAEAEGERADFGSVLARHSLSGIG